MTPDDISILIRDCLRGDHAAQRRLYERYSPRLYGLCLRYAASEAEAQDWLQEGMIRVFRDLEQFRGQGSLEGWMHRVVLRAVLGQIRRKRIDFPYDGELALVHVPDTAPSALDRLQAADIVRLIQQLPAGFRTVFNLYAVEGYSHAEIGELLGISEGTSRSQYARARAALQTLLRNENIGQHG